MCSNPPLATLCWSLRCVKIYHKLRLLVTYTRTYSTVCWKQDPTSQWHLTCYLYSVAQSHLILLVIVLHLCGKNHLTKTEYPLIKNYSAAAYPITSLEVYWQVCQAIHLVSNLQKSTTFNGWQKLEESYKILLKPRGRLQQSITLETQQSIHFLKQQWSMAISGSF